MRWDRDHQSSNVEDRRGQGGGGGGGGMRLGLGGFVVLAILSIVFKRNFFALVSGTGGPSASTGGPSAPRASSPDEEQAFRFVGFVLDDVQSVWARTFQASGRPYRDAALVVFRDSTASGCGAADAAMGPFYCPADLKVYVDLAFYDELKSRFGAPGDFAQAYVIAHEIGHHVQHLLGIDEKMRRQQEQRPALANDLSVRLELQADCLAGVWGHSTAQRSILEQGDVEEALGAATAIGDDRLQRSAGRRVNPETWTHGSSQQRVAWFNKGLTTGQVNACDTFSVRQP